MIRNILIGALAFLTIWSCSTTKHNYSIVNKKGKNMKTKSNKQKIMELLKSIETGNTKPIGYINPNKYKQHNLAVEDGLAGFGKLLSQLPEGSAKVNVIRAFEDGDYVFTHTEYNFFGSKVGFDIFRFEDGLIVEHWDNLTNTTPPNPSGRTQTDGPTEIKDLTETEENKNLVKSFITDVLMNGETNKIINYINSENYIQHNSQIADGLEGLGEALKYFEENGLELQYSKIHKILGEGNFVLSVSEGKFGKGEHVAYYDLWRIENRKIVEHWDVIETIPTNTEWKNNNGKF